MTEEEAIKICSVVKDVYDGHMEKNDAVAYITAQTRQSKNSAETFVYVFKEMKQGNCYKRAINQITTRLFLKQILADDGKDGLRLALKALMGNIEYRAEPFRKIYAEFSVALGDKKICPECNHIFQGNGWDGIDAHWRSKHENIMPYNEAWPLIQSGEYKPQTQ